MKRTKLLLNHLFIAGVVGARNLLYGSKIPAVEKGMFEDIKFRLERSIGRGIYKLSDFILYPDGRITQWLRKSTLCICTEDILEMIAEEPNFLIFGMGTETQTIHVLPHALNYLLERGVRPLFIPTDSALKCYQILCRKTFVIGAFHLRWPALEKE